MALAWLGQIGPYDPQLGQAFREAGQQYHQGKVLGDIDKINQAKADMILGQSGGGLTTANIAQQGLRPTNITSLGNTLTDISKRDTGELPQVQPLGASYQDHLNTLGNMYNTMETPEGKQAMLGMINEEAQKRLPDWKISQSGGNIYAVDMKNPSQIKAILTKPTEPKEVKYDTMSFKSIGKKGEMGLNKYSYDRNNLPLISKKRQELASQGITDENDQANQLVKEGLLYPTGSEYREEPQRVNIYQERLNQKEQQGRQKADAIRSRLHSMRQKYLHNNLTPLEASRGADAGRTMLQYIGGAEYLPQVEDLKATNEQDLYKQMDSAGIPKDIQPYLNEYYWVQRHSLGYKQQKRRELGS